MCQQNSLARCFLGNVYGKKKERIECLRKEFILFECTAFSWLCAPPSGLSLIRALACLPPDTFSYCPCFGMSGCTRKH